jgi:hypothetical protein
MELRSGRGQRFCRGHLGAFDAIVDFSGKKGKFLVLKNDAPGGGEVVPTEIMMFRVV